MNSAEPAQYFSRPTHPHQKDLQFAIRTGIKERNAYVSHFGQSAHSRAGTVPDASIRGYLLHV